MKSNAPVAACPSCGRELPATAKVCGYCGQRLARVPATPPPGSVKGFPPRAARNKIILPILLIVALLAAAAYALTRPWGNAPAVPTRKTQATATRPAPALAPTSTRVVPIPTQAAPVSCLRSYSEPEQSVSIPNPGNLSQIAAGDFNGDGRTDFLVARMNPAIDGTSPVDILLNDGHGGLYRATSQLFASAIPGTQNPREIVVADFNGDGRDDVFIADHGYDAPPFPGFPNTLILSAAGGRMVDATANLPQRAAFTHSAAAADVDGDGDIDLYVGDIDVGVSNPPQLLLNDGEGGFSDASQNIPAEYRDVRQVGYTTDAFADVNSDGAVDLILGADGSSPESVVLLNDGRGRFTALASAIPAKPHDGADIALDMKALDITEDGFIDLLVVYTKNDPFYQGRFIQVLINNGNGTFRDETATRLPQKDNLSRWLIWLDPVDLDGDGNMDLSARINGEVLPLFYLNDGAGKFAPITLGANILDARFALFFDLDGDGGRDILVSTPTFDTTAEWHYILRDLGCR